MQIIPDVTMPRQPTPMDLTHFIPDKMKECDRKLRVSNIVTGVRRCIEQNTILH